MTVEDLMDKLIAWLFNQAYDMLFLTEKEQYEEAAKIRDDIEYKIIAASRLLIKKNMTVLSFEDLIYNLNEIKLGIFKEISGLLNIPLERCVVE